MVALTSALQDRWVQTRASYSVSFCHRRADGSTVRVSKPKTQTSRQDMIAFLAALNVQAFAQKAEIEAANMR
jgi:hypothetical protein